MSTRERQLWGSASHERAVEEFYGWGVDDFADFHNGYLNFGLWEEGINDYLAAAENMVHRMGASLRMDERSRLLDVGCGMGTQDVYLLRTFNPQKIDALDVTWKHIQLAGKRVAEAGFADRVQFHHGTATQMPFADHSFTHLLSIEAPEHFRTREMFFREALRVLEPGGTISLADYTLKRPPRNLLERSIVVAARKLWKVPQENIVTTEEYRQIMERNGFVDIEVEEVGELTIPGYYFEQRRPEVIRELTRIRGFVAGRLGSIIDHVLYKAYRMGLVEYIFVRAKTPA